ncbi:alpha-hydroxy acid oxidase [Pseudarthrobacter sulfonivorans]|uniref:alpha-hydroxy acid oxidase n=1 Tax=Pseudarthrobacter sulfonivorans TaxID=121292 RepID=UPI0028560CA4|nr:alpha-hydroxy acid oxidase [Pseudarthrobacter sulfonivorans]MDR6414962.1 L-lactate dehydrogenase (cytochrome) [Pseudarthrobacter sulfonivorans]
MKFSDITALASVQGPARTESERLSRRCYSVEDMRKLAAKRLPGSIFDYIEGGGEDEVSLRRNRSSFDDWSFLPKWGSVENLDLSSTLLGGPVSMPLTLAPTGGTRLFHPAGEKAVARAAQQAGVPYGLAHLSTTPMEQVSAAAPAVRRWFNIEPIGDKVELQAVLDRAAAAGYEALLVNVDCRAIGHRERDYRNGFTAPPSIKLKTVVEGALHPRWALGFLGNDAIAFPNLDAEIPDGPLSSTPDMWRTLLAGSYEPTDWDDLRDLRARWNGPIILKGVVNPNDAVLAAEIGIDAIQVSNHGGRQLDHMASPLDVLPDIVDRVEGRLEIIVDGGIRRGSDVVKAIALGADGCSIGRPYLYGLAAAGQTGVAHVLQMFQAEMTRTMMLLGVSTIQELRLEGRDLIRHRNASSTSTSAAPDAPTALKGLAEMSAP